MKYYYNGTSVMRCYVIETYELRTSFPLTIKYCFILKIILMIQSVLLSMENLASTSDSLIDIPMYVFK